MMAFGRSLAVARDAAILASAASCAAAYLALRSAQVTRIAAIIATTLAMTLPWSAWLGATNVPEGFCAAADARGNGHCECVDPCARAGSVARRCSSRRCRVTKRGRSARYFFWRV